ncbi:PfkB family carbohydrate kinase [Corynebacterium freiburgense]|uniref:PfkB family carbohydrate kinase n=1 Tax=Corynebacterium freiburgense TaxID=556548 RepID=UPI0004244AD1|nr:PfkB family carbohydrate kinase [Corynebacterium freiburgense]WJZ02889.1 Tagatose-6-phosphate kinase [Corynebacterium freiburgense]
MILTLTPVPSLDRTANSSHELGPNQVCNLSDIATVPGGVGVNVAHTLYRAGNDVLAVFPAPEISHYMRLMAVTGTPHQIIPVPGPIQMHFTLTDPIGGTTILKDPPMPLDPSQLALLRDLTVTLAEKAQWVLLGGPLPDSATAAWYVEVIRALALYHPTVKVVVSTEGAAIQALVRQLAVAHPHTFALSLSDLEDLTSTSLAEANDATILATVDELFSSDVPEILIQCSRNYALLVNRDGAWNCRIDGQPGHQSIHYKESFLAGYLLAAAKNVTAEARISTALAYSHAQGSEWDNFIPTPNLLRLESVQYSRLR